MAAGAGPVQAQSTLDTQNGIIQNANNAVAAAVNSTLTTLASATQLPGLQVQSPVQAVNQAVSNTQAVLANITSQVLNNTQVGATESSTTHGGVGQLVQLLHCHWQPTSCGPSWQVVCQLAKAARATVKASDAYGMAHASGTISWA